MSIVEESNEDDHSPEKEVKSDHSSPVEEVEMIEYT